MISSLRNHCAFSHGIKFRHQLGRKPAALLRVEITDLLVVTGLDIKINQETWLEIQCKEKTHCEGASLDIIKFV